MLWQTPTQAFFAINPPDWLKHDLMLAERNRGLQGVRTLVFFADDLPHFSLYKPDHGFPDRINNARYEALDGLVQQAFGQSLEQLDLQPHMASEAHPNFDYDAKEGTYTDTHPLLGLVHGKTIYESPRHALIRLHARHMDPAMFMFRTTPDLWPQVAPHVNVMHTHRAALWHEIGHIRQGNKYRGRMTLKISEKDADAFSHKGCLRVSDGYTAQFGKDFRILDSFLSPADPGEVKYWNALSLNSPNMDDATEIAAHLEIKMRGTNILIAPDNMELVRAFMQHEETELSHPYAPRQIKPVKYLRNLAMHHRVQPYQSGASQKLAEQTLHAARRLLPGVLS